MNLPPDSKNGPKVSSPQPSQKQTIYVSLAYEPSHPNRMAVLAKLFGLEFPDLEKAEVLELGCSSGGNILPLASALPNAKFTGIDVSKPHISTATKLAEGMGLKNINFVQQDLFKSQTLGKNFDYIIAHGVFSWLPKEGQGKLLELISSHLKERGLAYISYNTYPGWHLKEAPRMLMRLHTAGIEKPADKAQGAASALKFLQEALGEEQSIYAQSITQELEAIAQAPSAQVLGEHLDAFNFPIYFWEFASSAGTAGLRYLGDSFFGTMRFDEYPESTRDALLQFSGDNIVRMEQYLDFVRNRSFRCSVMCRDTQTPKRTLSGEVLKGFYAASIMSPEEEVVDFTEGKEVKFTADRKERAVTVTGKTVKAVLAALGKSRPKALSFDEISKECTKLLGAKNTSSASFGGSLETEVARVLLELYSKELISLWVSEPKIASSVSEKPIVVAAARVFAQFTNSVPNAYHQIVSLNDVNRMVISFLDGQHTVAQVCEKLSQKLPSDEVQKALERLVKYGLLVG